MKRILYIADLHLTKVNYNEGQEVNTWFEDDLNFTDKFIDSVKDKLNSETIDNIVIAGDLSNMADEKEYDKVADFLDSVCKKLSVEKEAVLIIPGNHDVNWKLCEGHYNKYNGAFILGEKAVKKEPYEFPEKYSPFKKFYDQFYDNKKDFNPNKTVVWHTIYSDLNIILVGLNTNEHVSHHKDFRYGYLDHSKVKEEIEEIQSKNPDHKLIVFSHHIIAATNEYSGTIKNNNYIFPLLSKTLGISTYCCGHQHVGGGGDKKEEFGERVFFYSVGSLAKRGDRVQNSYCLLELDTSSSGVKLTKKEIDYVQKGADKQWSEPTSINHDIYSTVKADEIPTNTGADIVASTMVLKSAPVVIEFPRLVEYSNRLVKIVKENNYLKSGHFHWSPKTRTLGAIDTSAMFSKFEYLSLAKSAIHDLIKENDLTPNLVIGLGMEGNLLTANISSLLDCKTSFCPTISNIDHHNEFEKELNFEGVNNIALVSDVTSTGLSIKGLLDSNIELFKKIKKIYVISIFYISKNIKEPQVIFSDIDSRIEFYSICEEIKIDDCSYCGDSFKDCLISKENLETVYSFY